VFGERASIARAERDRSPARAIGVSGGLLVALLLGCTAPAAYTLAPGHENAPGVRRVLLCPLNVALALPTEISSGAAPVYQAIEAYLGSQGLEVKTLGLTEARASWRRAVVEANESGAQDASGLLAKDLGKRVGFDAVVIPALILRSVRVTDNSGTWDGVRRQVSMVNLPHRGRGVEADTFSKGIALGGISGSVMAASLYVLAYLPDGQRVFEGVGGFDFVQEADLGGAYRRSWELVSNPSLMYRPDVLREGVQIAFGPYLPPRSER